jgi:hypothetical protein
VLTYFAYLRKCFSRYVSGCKITKFNIGKLSGTAYQKALSAGNLTAAFKKTGIFPFNPKAVEREKVAPATIYKKYNPDDHVDDGQPEVIAAVWWKYK